MGDFKITDRRSSQRTSGLITDNVQSELSRVRAAGAGLGGPSHPGRKAEYTQTAVESVRDTGAFRQALTGLRTGNAMSPGESQIVNEMRANRMSKTAGDIVMALPKNREPLQTWKAMGIPTEVDSPEERTKIRMWARLFHRTHYLMATCVDIYTRFPVQGMELTCKDPEITRFYEELFFNELNYPEFLIDFGREHWTAGEANSLASWNETLGVWEDEEIINPDDLAVRTNPFTRTDEYRIKVPEYLRRVILNRSPKWEYDLLEQQFPEIVNQVTSDSFGGESLHNNLEDDDGAWERAGLDVSSVLLSRIVNKTTPWDKYGTPHMMRAFRQLMQEESLNAAQDAIADRLYAPFIFAKLGLTDAGDGLPWIPDQGQIDAFRDDMNSALAADFRLLVHHFGVDIKSVFGRESMPRFDSDYDRLERKQLQVWGIGESLLSGSSSGTYASSALNRELVTQLMTTYQAGLKRHFRKRAEIVAEAQEHFDYRSSGGIRIPIWEEVYEVDEEGHGYVRKRPKLLVPDLNFATMNLRDEATERQFLTTLKQQGVPIADSTLMVNIPFEFEEELEKVQQEKTKKVIAEAEFKGKVKKALRAKGLMEFAPEEYQDTPEAVEAPQDSDVDQSVEVYDDITSPPDAPNLAPNTEGSPSEPASGEGSSEESTVTRLPRNQITQRPEISDEQRGRVARVVTDENGAHEVDIDRRGSAGRLAAGPSHVGSRSLLGEASVEDAVQNREWSRERPVVPDFVSLEDIEEA